MSDQPPAEVYLAAAKAYISGTPGAIRQQSWDTLAKLRARDAEFQRAVDVAWRLGRGVYQDIAEAAIAYATEPEGSDQVEHYWWQLKGAVSAHLKADADADA